MATPKRLLLQSICVARRIWSIEKTIEYIKTQEEHHKKSDAREELISLLNAYNIEYDDRYI